MIAQKFGGDPLSTHDEKSIRKSAMTAKLDNLIKIENIFDIAKIFNREVSCQSQIPFDQLCQNELNVVYSVRKLYPRIYTEAKMCMALYQRWVGMKNGTESRDFKPQDEEEDLVDESFDAT